MPEQVLPSWIACYQTHPHPGMSITPALPSREWMDKTHDRHAYRCLPLLIANQNGWFILNRHHVRVIWNGQSNPEAVSVTCMSGPERVPCPAKSHFGHGVVTWDFNYLFRTSPGYNLWIKGPANWPKDGATPLEGIVETDWSVATFTMNWKITRVDYPVEFAPGEPICMIAPIRRGELESFATRTYKLEDDSELYAAHHAWAKSRGQFIQDLSDCQSTAAAQKWQRNYFLGTSPSGHGSMDHQVKLDLKDFLSIGPK